MNQTNLLVTNIGALLTLEPLAKENKISGINENDLGLIKDAWMYCEDGKVHSYGSMPVPESIDKISKLDHLDAHESLVLPGFVDSHTHPIFSGSRAHEFKKRLDGSSYQEIAQEGGGIKYTVTATREASNASLMEQTLKNLESFLRNGVTTVEVKSGYGLNVEEELRHLRILNTLRGKVSQKLKITCLALHALHEKHANNSEYIKDVVQNLLPQIAREKLADYVDAFIEEGYFSANECDQYFEQAKHYGLGIRIHADEFSDSKGALTAAKWKAASADHLQFASMEGIEAMAAQKVVATILPGTSLYTAIPFANGRTFISKGCPLAIASDFNPGSCLLKNLPQLAIVAGLQANLRSWEIISGITYVAAHSLGLANQKGALASGFDADFVLCNHKNFEEWLADMGQTPPKQVWIKARSQMT